jgi:hypothetical protein
MREVCGEVTEREVKGNDGIECEGLQKCVGEQRKEVTLAIQVLSASVFSNDI